MAECDLVVRVPVQVEGCSGRAVYGALVDDGPQGRRLALCVAHAAAVRTAGGLELPWPWAWVRLIRVWSL